MTDPQTPTLDSEQSSATDPIRYVEWVHFGDPGNKPAEPGSGGVSVAWALYFDGERVERTRTEVRHGGFDADGNNSYSGVGTPDDPWWARARQYRERVTSWQSHGGAFDGTVVSFWVDAEAVEIVEEEVTRLRVKVYGRDILTPLGYPVPSPPSDRRYPVQVHMFVNQFSVGPMLADGSIALGSKG